MFPLNDDTKFSALSLRDLLDAREQFHVHLINKANVVGTAVGRYLIRKSDPYPTPETDPQRKRGRARKPKNKGPRNLGNSEVRDYSWPCVLVFVSQWVEAEKFSNRDGALPATEFVPKTIYLPDGRRVPICVVEAPLVERAVAAPGLDDLRFPATQIGGGYPVVSHVQGRDHLASIGCLVTDGHLLYALTSRHVVGEPGEELFSVIGGERVSIGRGAALQLRRANFSEVYPGWPGTNVFVNLDVGLIEVHNEADWTTQVYGVGTLGRLADLNMTNLSLDVVDAPVRAYGCASGALFGKISALFYRFKTVGGFEYVADFLIGSRTEDPLPTRPGDSGTIWVVETRDPRLGLLPIGIQWGGSVFAASRTQQFPFALATNLSTVCRVLDVDILRDRNLASFNYWGAVGHYTIGRIACDLVSETKLQRLMTRNRLRVSFEHDEINSSNVEGLNASGFVPLANVPDVVWKKTRTAAFPAGRRGADNPTHYADMDELTAQGQTLFDQINAPADLTVAAFQTYYNGLGHQSNRSRGSLPLRVWQFYDEMVAAASEPSVSRFVAAAGILAHYVGDACQVLHGSYLADGDPARQQQRVVHHRDGTVETVTEIFGKGVHSAYETRMVNKNIDTLMGEVRASVGAAHGMALVQSGQAAAFATVELMKRTRARAHPMEVVETFATALQNGENVADALWDRFAGVTRDAIADGCRVLAMLWDSAWQAGNGAAIADNRIRAQAESRLMTLYSDQTFVPSLTLDDYPTVLQ